MVMTKLAEIAAAALRLPEKERLHLADQLLGSLPPPPAAGETDEILAEALRRDAEMESGRVQPLSEDAFWTGVRRGG
jgi:putative addiction module component (TIGR02574 family)